MYDHDSLLILSSQTPEGKRKSASANNGAAKRPRGRPPLASAASASAPPAKPDSPPTPPLNNHPGPPPSPALTLTLAIQTVEGAEQLNETEFVRAVRLFQRRPAAAEAYLAIKSQTARSMYLRAELEEFRAASENGHSISAPSSGSA